ncbi:MAG: hypothetical protein QF535_18520, partial [Anaerolineales bacterium]|nr:hypothetical protein [Anaerolineales bacterium]
LIDGTITFKDYIDTMDQLNDELDKEKSIYKVNVIKEADISNLLHILPAQLVVYKGSEQIVNGMYDSYDWEDIGL